MTDEDRPQAVLLQRLRRGGLWVFGGRAAGMAVVFTLHVVLAKLLSPSDFAAVVLASSIVTFGSVAAGLGIPTLICRYLAESFGVGDFERSLRALRMATALGVVASLIVGVIAWKFVERWAVPVFDVSQLADAALYIAVWLVLLSIMQLLAESFRGLHEMRFASLFGGASGGLFANGLVLLLLLVASVWQPLDFSKVAKIFVVSFVPAIVVAAFLLRRSWWKRKTSVVACDPSPSSAGVTVQSLLADAIPLCALQLLSVAMDQGDIWMVGAWMDEENIAIYGALRRLAFLGLIPLTQVGLAIASSIAELHSQNQQRPLQQILRGGATFSFLSALLIAVPCIIFARDILSHLFGPSYAAGASALIVVLLSQLIHSWLGPSFPTLMMTGNQRIALLCHLAAAPLLLLAPWSTTHFGLIGMAATASTMVVVSALLMWLAVRYRLGIWCHASLAPAFAVEMVSTLLGHGKSTKTSQSGLTFNLQETAEHSK